MHRVIPKIIVQEEGDCEALRLRTYNNQYSQAHSQNISCGWVVHVFGPNLDFVKFADLQRFIVNYLPDNQYIPSTSFKLWLGRKNYHILHQFQMGILSIIYHAIYTYLVQLSKLAFSLPIQLILHMENGHIHTLRIHQLNYGGETVKFSPLSYIGYLSQKIEVREVASYGKVVLTPGFWYLNILNSNSISFCPFSSIISHIYNA